MTDSDGWERLSCWPLCRLSCMAALMGEKVSRGLCYLDHICVDEGFRGKGVGTALMTVADLQARANNCHTIYLWVATDNRAKNLYSRAGYQTTESTTACCMAGCFTGRSSFDKMVKTL